MTFTEVTFGLHSTDRSFWSASCVPGPALRKVSLFWNRVGNLQVLLSWTNVPKELRFYGRQTTADNDQAEWTNPGGKPL